MLTLGHLAERAYRAFADDPARGPVHVSVLHPTYPETASAAGSLTREEAWLRLVHSWNNALDRLSAVVAREVPGPVLPYTGPIGAEGLREIPEADLPAGLPGWMRSRPSWAERTGADRVAERATLTVRVPRESIG